MSKFRVALLYRYDYMIDAEDRQEAISIAQTLATNGQENGYMRLISSNAKPFYTLPTGFEKPFDNTKREEREEIIRLPEL
jgi:hypothetical protein